MRKECIKLVSKTIHLFPKPSF